MSGKGHRPRPIEIRRSTFDTNWDRVFGRAAPATGRRYCFDIDGTLCSQDGSGDYRAAQPLRDRIARVNALYEAGNYIIVLTARGAESGINWRRFTEDQLRFWGVRYHELHLSKPFAHVYVDDRACEAGEFFDAARGRNAQIVLDSKDSSG